MTSLDAPLSGAADWTEPGPLAPISPAEVEALAGLEQVIEGGLVAFVAVGTALAEVRDRRLYRGDFTTFEAYCDARWGIARSRAYQMIEAAEVVSTMVDSGAEVLPANERQARALAVVPVEERSDVITEVARDGKVTAKAIEAKREERHPKPDAGRVQGADARGPCRVGCGAGAEEEVKRSALSRGAGPKRTAPPKRKTALRGASPKTIAARPSKAAVREAVFARDGGCRMARHPSPCSGRLTPHHLRKSSDLGKYDEGNLIALCVFHNCTWVEGHPIEAEAMGLAERGIQTRTTTWLKLFLAGLAASPEVGSGPVPS